MARIRDQLIAHGPLWEQLLTAVEKQGGSMTLLFAGLPGIGKNLAARALAQAVLCEKDPRGCGVCGSCLRVESGHHESLMEVKPDGTQIKTDQAREVVEFLHLSHLGRGRVIIIDGANVLNPAAANSLLKSLEEPPPHTLFILIAPSPTSVLATLRSRSRTVLFRPLTVPELKKIQDAPEWALQASRGSVEKLKELMESDLSEIRTSAASVLESMLTDDDFLIRSSWREYVREKGVFPRMIRFWISFARDGLVIHAKGQKTLANPDQKTLLAAMAKENLDLVERFGERCLQIETELTFNRDSQLVIEELFMDLRTRREAGRGMDRSAHASR